MAPKPAPKRASGVNNLLVSLDAYTRKPLPAPEPGTIQPLLPPPTPRLSTTPVSLDAALPDWNEGLVDEKWDNFETSTGTFIDTAFELQDLPPHLQGNAKSWSRPLDMLNPTFQKLEEQQQAGAGAKKGGKDAKKPAPPPPAKKTGAKDNKAAVVWSEKDTDDMGRILPKVVCDDPLHSVTSHEAMRIPGAQALARPFRRQWTKQQEEVLRKLANADGAQQGSELIPPTTPGGAEIDSVFVSVVRMLESLGPALIPNHGNSTSTQQQPPCPYLWNAIHPQTPEGKPVYNPGGKYCVKLWAAGKWRKVAVDDRVPVDSSQHTVCASTEEPKELWPLLLSKALYKLYNLTGSRALAPDITSDQNALTSFMSYALHALTGSMAGVLNTNNHPDTASLLGELEAGGTPLGDMSHLKIDHTPWITIENEKPLRKRLLFRRKNKNKKRLQVYFDEVEQATQQQKKKLDSLTSLLEQPRSKVYVACFIEEKVEMEEVMVVSEPPEATSSPQPSPNEGEHEATPTPAPTTTTATPENPNGVDQPLANEPQSNAWATDRPPVVSPRRQKQTIRRVSHIPVVRPLLAVTTNSLPSNVMEEEKEGNAGSATRALLSIHYQEPRSDVKRDEHGTAVHKRLKGDPTLYFYTVKEEWCTLADLMNKGAVILSLVVPRLTAFTDHLPVHCTSSPKGEPLPAALPGPVFLHVNALPRPDQGLPTQLFLGLVKDREANPHEGGQEKPQDDEITVYLQEVAMPKDPKVTEGQARTNNPPPTSKEPMGMAVASGAGSLQEGENENEQSGLGVAPTPTTTSESAIFLRTKLSSASSVPFGYASAPILPKAGGRLYRVHVHAPHGATVLFSCNDAHVKVGDAAAIWKASTTTGSTVEEQGTYDEVPAGTYHILFRRVVRVEPFSGPGHVMIQLHLKDQRAHRYVRLVTVDNDLGEEVEHPLHCTGYLKLSVNKLGYTVMATYLSTTQDCTPGNWRLLLFSDALLVQPLTKHECGVLTRYGGIYTANKYLRLFRDVISAPAYPLALRLKVSDPTMALHLSILNEKTKETLCQVRGRGFLHVPSLGLDPLADPEKKYILDLCLDPEHMEVPALYQSVRPYYFSQDSSVSASEEAVLGWTLEVISSTPVSMVHDITDVNRFAKVRAAWEAAQPGRAERAMRVRGMYLKSVSSSRASFTAPQRLEVMGNFLTTDKEMARQNRRKSLCPPTLIVHQPGEGVDPATSSSSTKLLCEEELALRLTEHQEKLAASVAKLGEDSLQRKELVRCLQEEIQRQCKELEEVREVAIKRKDEVWALRESYRVAHVARLAQEAAALAAAQEAANPTTKKR